MLVSPLAKARQHIKSVSNILFKAFPLFKNFCLILLIITMTEMSYPSTEYGIIKL